jgi:hypothetical protein
VKLRDGRTTTVRATISPPRPRIELMSRAIVSPGPDGGLPLTLPDGAMSPDGTLTFSVRVASTRLAPGDAIEVATQDEVAATKLTVAGGALQLVGDVAVARLRPREALGAGAVGPLKMRLVQGEAMGDWQPLARVVRLPDLRGVTCAAACTLHGGGLYLIAAVAADAAFAQPVTVPLGFVATELEVPHPVDGTLFLKLHDAPDDVVRVTTDRKDGEKKGGEKKGDRPGA